jgi:HAD superfamily hydrolase (TIGR01509 family)
MNELKAVLFDVGGVLISGDVTWPIELAQTLKLPEQDLAEIIRTDIPRFSTGKIDELTLWKNIARKYNVRVIQPREDLFGRSLKRDMTIHKEVIEYAHSLKNPELKVGIISNTYPAHARVLEEAGVYANFKPLFLSFKTGYQKPNPMAYHLILDALQLEGNQVLVIDNDAKNLAAAKILGIRTIHFTDLARLERDIQKFVAPL